VSCVNSTSVTFYNRVVVVAFSTFLDKVIARLTLSCLLIPEMTHLTLRTEEVRLSQMPLNLVLLRS